AVARLARQRGREKSARQETGEPQRRRRAQQLERRNEPLLGRGEVAAEGKRRQQALFARGSERVGDALGRIVAAGGRARARARRSSSSWKRESATASMAAITSRSLFPRRSATPYSVTTMSRRWRGIVVWP